MLPSRRKPLALLVCCGMTGTLAGAFAVDAQAQGMPALRVDPVLLGLPPAAPVKPPEAAPVPKAEAKPVEAPTVESVELRPLPEEAAPRQAEVPAAEPSVKPTPAARARSAPAKPAAAVIPVSAPVVVPEKTPEPARPAPVVAAPPQRAPREETQKPEVVLAPEAAVRQPPVAPAALPRAAALTQTPVAVPSPARNQVQVLAPLRVDPALLGLPPAAATQMAKPEGLERGIVTVDVAARGASPTASGNAAAAVLAGDGEGEAGVDGTPALSLRLSKRMTPVPKGALPLPSFLSANRIHGIADREAVAEGNAQLRKVGTVVDADLMTYWPLDDELEAVGNVKLTQGQDVITGPKLRLKLEDQVGFFEQPTYFLKREANQSAATGFVQPVLGASNVGLATAYAVAPPKVLTEGHGQAERIDFEGENQVRISKGTYTTCKPGSEDWYARAEEMKLDYDSDEGEAKNGVIVFQGLPILYSPWLSFSLNNQRKSGLLAPTFGTTSLSGVELTTPYYWNIAPNMDATIAPRVFTKRGLQLNTEFRYLDPYYNGLARLELLPNDKLRNENRYSLSLQHNHLNLGRGFSGSLNLNAVSDGNYFTDLSSRVATTAQTQLLRQGILSYGGGGWWNVSAVAQGYQTLQPDPTLPVGKPYSYAPQLTLNARQPDLYGTDSSLFGQFTSFTHATLTEGRRTVLYPQLAVPFVTPGWYVTPKVGVHATYYSLSQQDATTPASQTRSLPVVSVDSGMTFERPSNLFGRDYTQTLEPRLYYLYAPFRDQSRIPLFDSGLADFNFAQIFAENQFAGQDRFSDANQLTAAATSRLIDPESGAEYIRAMIGQRFYFSDQRVTLPGQTPRDWKNSDTLAALSGQLLPRVYVDGAVQYSSHFQRIERSSLGGRYLPEAGKVLNATYRFNRDLLNPLNDIEQVDFSGQWPIYGGWHGVGRYNYSLKEAKPMDSLKHAKPIEIVGGLEYNGGCWVLRMVGQQLATTSAKASTAIFVQLELNEFSSIGSNPLEILKRNIQGYGKINQPVADPVFGQ